MWELILFFAVGAACLAVGTNTKYFNTPADSRTQIQNVYAGKRGVYIWTNILNGNQYVGSSNDLGTRLGAYFQPAYLRKQVSRGSAICAALLKYGMPGFTLQVIVIGPSLQTDTPHSDRDYLVLEQYYMDKYPMVYNVNRTATGSARPTDNKVSSPSLNSGSGNASWGLIGAQSFAWGQQHNASTIQHFSDTRGSYQLFAYSSITFQLVNFYTSGKAFSSAMGYSASFVLKVMNALNESVSGAVIFASYIITTVPCTPGMLETVYPSLNTVVAPVSRAQTFNSTIIYGLHVETGNLYTCFYM